MIFIYILHEDIQEHAIVGSVLLTWIDFNPSMDE